MARRRTSRRPRKVKHHSVKHRKRTRRTRGTRKR